MGGDPAAGGQSPEGFAPQGVDPNAGMDGMGGSQAPADPAAAPMADPAAAPAMGQEQEGDEVVDVDELIDSQEKAEEKIDKMNDKFERLLGAVESLVKQNQEQERKQQEMVAKFEAEMEKRNPTPMQRMTMRSTKSAPYSMSPNEYMDNYAPDNYSAEPDNNGADDPQYKITQDDIDRFTDYNAIAKDLDVTHQGLHDILGY